LYYSTPRLKIHRVTYTNHSSYIILIFSWSITARVLKKSDVLPFKHGNGKYFTTILIDKTTVIRATAFGDDVDRLFSQLWVT